MSNSKNRAKTLYLVQLALLTAITLILNFTPLGFLKIGLVEITFMAVPVVIGGVILGPLAGAFLGLVFGICSLSLAPAHPLFGIVFSKNPILVAAVCIIPRILVGLAAAYVVKIPVKEKFKGILYFLAGLVGSLTNTVLFLAGIMLFMEKLITPKMTGLSLLTAKTFTGFWVGIGIVNGIPEAVACTVLSGVIIIALKSYVLKKIK